MSWLNRKLALFLWDWDDSGATNKYDVRPSRSGAWSPPPSLRVSGHSSDSNSVFVVDEVFLWLVPRLNLFLTHFSRSLFWQFQQLDSYVEHYGQGDFDGQNSGHDFGGVSCALSSSLAALVEAALAVTGKHG